MPTPSASWTAARWHQLFCACQQQLVSYLAGKTGSRDEAQELAQETWLRLADAPPQLPDGSSPTLEAARAYLFATAKHLAGSSRSTPRTANQSRRHRRVTRPFTPQRCGLRTLLSLPNER